MSLPEHTQPPSKHFHERQCSIYNLLKQHIKGEYVVHRCPAILKKPF